MVQSGGTNSISGALFLGDTASAGTYNLGGTGLLTAPTEYIGWSGSGSFTHSGGTNSATTELDLGYGSGATGSYSLSGSGLLTVPVLFVGNSGSGTFTQSGGTNTVSDRLRLGWAPGSSGTYNLNGGFLALANSDTHSLLLLSVGNSGNGTFNQTGGTLTGNNYPQVNLGTYSGSSGTYSLGGSGSMAVGALVVGWSGSGLFSQTGGSNSVLTLFVAYGSGSGSYNLGGNGLLVSSPYGEYVGESGNGVFTQSGGTHSVQGFVQLADQIGSTGTYNLLGGLLTYSDSTIGSNPTFLSQGSGTATFNFTGGTIQAGAGFSAAAPMVFNRSGSGGTFDTRGNTITLANSLSGPGNLNKGGSGMLVLDGSDTYTGATSVNGGTLALLADNASSSFTANNGTTLIFGPATFNLNLHFVRALSGGTVQYQNTTINGGFLRGPGTHVALAGTSNIFNGVTTYVTTNFQQNGTTTLIDFNNGGQIANNAPLIWDGGINNGGANLVVNSTVSTNDWTNAGVVTINHGGVLNNHLGDATSFGGGRIYVNSGGTLNADSQNEGVALDLQDSLLVNNGRVIGTTNVYYGATVSGSGSFGAINVLQAGALVAAASAVPAPTSLTVNGGTITGAGKLSASATLADAIIATPNLADTLTLAGNLSGPGPITKIGAGMLILSGTNTYGAGTILSAGKLEVTQSYALPDGSNLSVGSGIIAFGAPVPASAAVQVAPVPEPGTLALLIAGAALMTMYRKGR